MSWRIGGPKVADRELPKHHGESPIQRFGTFGCAEQLLPRERIARGDHGDTGPARIAEWQSNRRLTALLQLASIFALSLPTFSIAAWTAAWVTPIFLA